MLGLHARLELGQLGRDRIRGAQLGNLFLNALGHRGEVIDLRAALGHVNPALQHLEPREGFFDPAASTHKALTADHTAITSRAASIAWPDTGASSWTFTAFCESFKANSSEGNPLQFDAGVRITGSTTFPT